MNPLRHHPIAPRADLRHGQAVALMVAVTLMWSIAGVVTRQLQHTASFEVTFWRSLFTLASLLVLLPLAQGRAVLTHLRHGGSVLWISGLCWAFMFTSFMLALTLTTVANVLITLALGPLLTALVARVLIGHRIALRTGLAIALAGLGMGWMYAAQLSAGHWLGSLLAFCVPLSGAVNWSVIQRAQAQGNRTNLGPAVLIGAVLSCLVTLPLALPFQASATDLAWLALLGLVQLAIPCTLAVRCARVLPPPELALLALLEVLFGIAWAWLGAGEAPPPEVLSGGGLVLFALLTNEYLSLRARAA